MATFPVKYINESMRGAPIVSGTAGALLPALRAFLLTGFGQVTALSVNVAGGIATASLTPDQSFSTYSVVLVAGATPSALNGEARVLTASASSITWATTAADGAATGTITIKVAPVGGWEELFIGSVTNKAVFRSTDPLSPGFCLQVDDTGAAIARVRGYKTMADVDTGTGPFPTDAQINGGGYWYKSAEANSTAVRYDFMADSRTLLLAFGAGAGRSALNISSPVRGFGDMIPLRMSGDIYSAAVSCSAVAGGVSGSSFGYGAFDAPQNGADSVYCASDVSGLGSADKSKSTPYVCSTASAISGNDSGLGVFPSPVDGELKYTKRYLTDGATSVPRAEVPGMLHVPQSSVKLLISPRDLIPGSGDMAGRMLLALGTGASGANGVHPGISLVDITGPWQPE